MKKTFCSRSAFFSKKCKSGDQKIILCEDNKIINNSNEVSNLFNNFFATVADQKIGENVVYDPSNHPSITAIHENNSIELNGKFGFQKVTSEKVEKIMNKINVKKSNRWYTC